MSIIWTMTEDRGPDSLEARLKALLEDFGLWGYHMRDSRTAERKGWPDWVILGPRGALFRELKTERGRLTPDQRRVRDRLTNAGLDWGIWRPSDLVNGTIHRQLLTIRVPE